MKRSPHATFFTVTSERLSIVRATNVGGSATFAFLVSPSVEKVLVPNTPDAACTEEVEESWGAGVSMTIYSIHFPMYNDSPCILEYSEGGKSLYSMIY